MSEKTSEKLEIKIPFNSILLAIALFGLLGYLYYNNIHAVIGVIVYVLFLNFLFILSIFGLPGYIIAIALLKLYIIPFVLGISGLQESIITTIAFWFYAILYFIYATIITILYIDILKG